MSKKPQQYQLASSKKFMEKESSGFTASFLKIPQGASIYQLKVGKASLDIIPYTVGKGNPNADEDMLYWERLFWVHRNVGPNQNTYICPAKTANKPCPICDDRARILRSDPDEQDMETMKNLAPKEWLITQFIDRNNEDKGIQLLPLSYHRFANTVQEGAAAGDEDDHWENFWHPVGGKTLRVQWGEDSIGRQKFIRALTVLFKDREDLEDDVMDQAFCLDDLLIIPDYKKLKAVYTAAAPAEEEEDEEDPKLKKKSSRPRTDVEEDEEPDEDKPDEGDEEPEEDEPKVGKKSYHKARTDTDEEDEEPEEDDEPPKKKKKSRPEPEDEEEPEEDDEPPKKKKSPVKEDEDEEPEDEGEEQETPRGGKFRTASAGDTKRAKEGTVKKKKSEEPDDWDGYDADQGDEEPEEEEKPEEDEEPPKKKKK